MAAWICSYSDTRALVRSNADSKCYWVTISAPVHVSLVEARALCRSRQARKIISLWAWPWKDTPAGCCGYSLFGLMKQTGWVVELQHGSPPCRQPARLLHLRSLESLLQRKSSSGEWVRRADCYYNPHIAKNRHHQSICVIWPFGSSTENEANQPEAEWGGSYDTLSCVKRWHRKVHSYWFPLVRSMNFRSKIVIGR